MNPMLKFTLPLLTILFISCDNKPQVDTAEYQETEYVFPRGEQISSDNFTGVVWVNFLVRSDSLNQTSVGNVTFEPGTRTNWHSHPAGQIILATGGVGYYQEKGSQKRILRKGDAVKCPPHVPHWHGASPDQEFVQIAITGREKGPTKWLSPVTDEEYHK